MGKYETTLTKFIPNPKDLTQHFEVLNAAIECDRLTRELIGSSITMAERFTSYADSLSKGNIWDPPSSSSAIHDISINSARLRCSQENLASLIRLTLGTDTLKQFLVELRKEFAA